MVREGIVSRWIAGDDATLERNALADLMHEGLAERPRIASPDVLRGAGKFVSDAGWLWWDIDVRSGDGNLVTVKIARLMTPAPMRFWYRDQMKAG
jgi:hypothetical protein